MGRSEGRSKSQETALAGDVAFAYAKDEQGVHVLRRRSEGGPIEAGVVRPLVEGRPITEEVVSLRSRSDAPFLFDVKTELEPQEPREPRDFREPRGAGDGPSQVVTDSYRKGWESIFGGKRGSTRALN